MRLNPFITDPANADLIRFLQDQAIVYHSKFVDGLQPDHNFSNRLANFLETIGILTEKQIAQVDEPDEDDLQVDEPNEDDLIFSSLKHEFEYEELPDPVGGDLIKTIFEKRGIRSSTRRVFTNQSDSHERMLSTAKNTQYLLFMAANRQLRLKGEMDFFDVASFAEQVADAEAKDLTETTSRHFKLWLETIVTKYGHLSIETAAARFLEAQDHLFTLYQTAGMQAAVFDYADAWHWLHLELFGEHELAANAEAAQEAADAAQRLAAKTIAGRSQGPQAQKQAGALRMAIIEGEYKKYAARETNPDRRTSAKSAASEIIDDVNAVLKLRRLGSFSITTLEQRLPKIINGV